MVTSPAPYMSPNSVSLSDIQVSVNGSANNADNHSEQGDLVTITPAMITVLGAGAWGSVLGRLIQANQHRVKIWSRSNGVNLPESVNGADILISAISMKGVPTIVQRLQTIGLPSHTIIVTATKGLDPDTLQMPSQIWQQAFPHHSIVVLSGPNLAKEIEQGLPAATVVASHDTNASASVQKVFASDTFRVYTNTDPLGTELGGTLKNVIAIAVGVCDGLNLGTNAKAALITRALPEILSIGHFLGAQTETFWGLSGLGDMLATCSSSLSRNYRVGYGLAQGKTLNQVLDELDSTAEGVNTAHVLIDLANHHSISVPISRQVHQLLNGMITPTEAVDALMARDLKAEACRLR